MRIHRMEQNPCDGMAGDKQSRRDRKAGGPLASDGGNHCLPTIANIARTASAMTRVAAQPITLSTGGKVNSPMIAPLVVINIIIAITGTATTPLITAVQNNA